MRLRKGDWKRLAICLSRWERFSLFFFFSNLSQCRSCFRLGGGKKYTPLPSHEVACFCCLVRVFFSPFHLLWGFIHCLRQFILHPPKIATPAPPPPPCTLLRPTPLPPPPGSALGLDLAFSKLVCQLLSAPPINAPIHRHLQPPCYRCCLSCLHRSITRQCVDLARLHVPPYPPLVLLIFSPYFVRCYCVLCVVVFNLTRTGWLQTQCLWRRSCFYCSFSS